MAPVFSSETYCWTFTVYERLLIRYTKFHTHKEQLIELYRVFLSARSRAQAVSRDILGRRVCMRQATMLAAAINLLKSTGCVHQHFSYLTTVRSARTVFMFFLFIW
jgi:hypothetical protein